jgi:hypothetical protein
MTALPGSPVTPTDEKYFCRSCLCTEHADYIESTGSITCALCDSDLVIPLDVKRREDVLARDAAFAAADREAEARNLAAEALV